MSFHGKKYIDAIKAADHPSSYAPEDALDLIAKVCYAKFDETVEVHMELGVDNKQADQQVRGSVLLPHGTGKKVRVLVFADGEKASEAREAGADYVGSEDLVDRIQKDKWLDFDVVVSTPNLMPMVGRLGRILGPKGLMPSPKAGTVTMSLTKTIQDVKAGRIEYRIDKARIIHAIIGKVSFGTKKLKENFDALLTAIIKSRPSSAKGQYIKNTFVCSSMGPSIRLMLG